MLALSSAELVDLGNVLVAERDLDKVGRDARGRDGLGDDRVAADGAPGDEDLGGGGANPVMEWLGAARGGEEGSHSFAIAIISGYSKSFLAPTLLLPRGEYAVMWLCKGRGQLGV